MARKKIRPEPSPESITLSRVCLTKRCGGQYRRGAKDGSARGLCRQCYQSARRMGLIKETTWRELEDMGLAEAPVRKRKGWDTEFNEEFRRRKEIEYLEEECGPGEDYMI